MKKILFLMLLSVLITIGTATAEEIPKREFRGAWLHTVGNAQFKTMSKDSIQEMLRNTLDIFKEAGINAVIFQVRPQADAFYKSDIEPWSRFLSGEQGVAPKEMWDPLEFMVEESHKRGMELHAWCNPYRVTSNDKEQLHPDHLYFKNPSIFKKYGKQLYFDPGEPEAIEHTVKVIADIVSRYDIDAIHFDDYFYPYPVRFEEFHDDESFVKYAADQGFEYWQKSDWRRNNVTTLIKALNDTIKAIKPWVRFGISPFGIHRNIKDTPDSSGSNTNGLSNYDQLYADVPLWIKNNWIDYNVPQLYWKIGHPAADYKTLIEWWNRSNYNKHLYIGQSIRTFNEPDREDPTKPQFGEKMELVRELPNVHGNVWWPGWTLVSNKNFTDSLKYKYQRYPALIPAYKHLDSIPPEQVLGLSYSKGVLHWNHNHTSDKMQEPFMYAIYRFPDKGSIDISDSQFLIEIVRESSYKIQDNSNKKDGYYYVVTAIDRCWNESVESKPLKVK